MSNSLRRLTAAVFAAALLCAPAASAAKPLATGPLRAYLRQHGIATSVPAPTTAVNHTKMSEFSISNTTARRYGGPTIDVARGPLLACAGSASTAKIVDKTIPDGRFCWRHFPTIHRWFVTTSYRNVAVGWDAGTTRHFSAGVYAFDRLMQRYLASH